jgi:hypothetical protein
MEDRRDTISKSYSNTCEWLFQKDEYLSWRDSAKMPEHYGFFWIKSKPGSGKSTLMKFFFKSAKEQLPDDNVISFFFNARGEALERSLEGLYRSLLYQLMTKIPRLQLLLRAADSSTSNHQHWSLESLKSLFADAVMHLEGDRLTCLIDALDECPEAEIREMIEFFEELGESAADQKVELRVCFSSRYYPHVTMDKCQDMLLDHQAEHEEDITKYIKSKLKARKGKTGDELREAVQAKAQGVFMWMVLVVRILNEESDRGSNNASLRKCLDRIPSELHELFEDILQRGIRDDENLVPILQWISFAQRPLACEELYFAVRSDRPDFDVAEPWDKDEDDTETMKLFILNSSRGLAELTRGKKPTVQFIHESVRDYLRETGFRILAPDLHSSLLGSTHEYLKRCCSQWMSDGVIERLALPKDLPAAKSHEAKELRDKATTCFPFLNYSVNYLIHHAEMACCHGVSQANFVEKFPLAQWTSINNALAIYSNRRRCKDPNDTPMCIFIENSASQILKNQLNCGWCPSYGQCEQILKAAVTSGNIETLEVILHEPSLRTITNRGFQELVYLALEKHDAMALRIILSRTKHNGSILGKHLERAYRTMKQDLVQVLLSWPHLEAAEQLSVLLSLHAYSIRNDKPNLSLFCLVQLRALLGDVARSNSIIDKLTFRTTGLVPEIYRPVLMTTIETESIASAGGPRRRTAIVSACTQGFQDIVYDMLILGYGVDAMDSTSYFDALSGASRNGHGLIVDALLVHDTRMALQDPDSYREVVQAVTMGRFSDILKSLLDRCNGFRSQSRATYRGPLRQAIQLGFQEIERVLRERDVTLPEDEMIELELPSSAA